MKLNKWELRANEKLLGEAAASYITKQMIVMPKPNPGKLHITDQRVVFTDALTLFFDYPLDQVVSFSAGMGSLTLTTADGKSHKLTGMFIKKLASALEQAGVRKA